MMTFRKYDVKLVKQAPQCIRLHDAQRKTRHRGLAKNTAQLFTLFAFANLVLAERHFMINESHSPS